MCQIIYLKNQLTLPLLVCVNVQMYRELCLHLVQGSLGFDNVGEFYDGPHLLIKIVNVGGNYFFRLYPTY